MVDVLADSPLDQPQQNLRCAVVPTPRAFFAPARSGELVLKNGCEKNYGDFMGFYGIQFGLSIIHQGFNDQDVGIQVRNDGCTRIRHLGILF